MKTARGEKFKIMAVNPFSNTICLFDNIKNVFKSGRVMHDFVCVTVRRVKIFADGAQYDEYRYGFAVI
jgi:hypothetical protein